MCITRFLNGNYKTFKIAFSKQNRDILNSQIFLSPIGQNRASNLVHQMQKEESKQEKYSQKMKSIVSLANNCAEYLGQGRFEDLGRILHEGWLLKKSLGEFISNKEIDKRYDLLIQFGAEGGRLLGAGMSGF